MHLAPGEYVGRVTRSLEIAGLRLSDVSAAPFERMAPHTHEPPFIVLVLSGAHRERFGATERIYGACSVTCRPAAFEHQVVMGPQGERFFSIELGPSWVQGLEHLTLTEIEDLRAFRTLFRMHREFMSNSVDAFAMEAFATDLIAHSLCASVPAERRRPPWLASVVDYLHASQAGGVRVGPLAECAGVHPVHVARVFRQVYRCSMAEYVAGIRVRRACSLLGERELTLAQIALRTGFTDQSHFTRAFSAIVGRPPGAFRRAVLESP